MMILMILPLATFRLTNQFYQSMTYQFY